MQKPTENPRNALSDCAAWALLAYMCDVSQSQFKQPWAPHLEELLWADASRALEGKSAKTISDRDAAVLSWLSMSAGGWWSWFSRENTGPTFVTNDIWEERGE